MLTHPNPAVGFVPMLDERDDLAKFQTRELAEDAAKENTLGETFGYEVFERGVEYE